MANPFYVQPAIANPQLQQSLAGLGAVTAGIVEAKRAEVKKAEMQQALQQAWESGDDEQLMQFMLGNPEAAPFIQQMIGFKDEQQAKETGKAAAQLLVAAESGNPDMLAKTIEANAQAITNLGQDPAELAQMIQENPKEAARNIRLIGMSSMGAKEFIAEQGREADRMIKTRGQDITMRGQDINAETARQAQAIQIRGQNQQAAQAAARLAFDQQKHANDMQIAAMQLQQKLDGGGDLPVYTQKVIEQSVGDAASSNSAANSMETLARQFREVKPTGGLFGNMQSVFSELTGSDTALRDLRIRFTALKNADALNYLPPGASSDSDVSLIMAGFPTTMDNPEQIARYLDAAARTERRNAAFNEFKSEWYSNNRGSGANRRDNEILGMPVTQGESFQTAAKRFMAEHERSIPQPEVTIKTTITQPSQVVAQPMPQQVTARQAPAYGAAQQAKDFEQSSDYSSMWGD